MRRVVLWTLVIGLALTLGSPAQDKKQPRPASPYAGTWKVQVLDNGEELAVWLLHLDPGAAKKKAEVLWGVETRQNDFKSSEATLLKADAVSVRVKLRTSGRDYILNAQPPNRDFPDQMLGTVTIGAHIGPVRLMRTDDRRFRRDRPVSAMDGAKELEATTRLTPMDARLSAIEGIIKHKAGKPIALIAGQVGVTQLVANAAAPAEFKRYVTPFLKEAALYGREMRLGAHLALCRTLLGGAKTRELALEHGKEAVKLVREKEDPHLVQLYAYVLLASTQQVLKKENEVKLLAPKIKSLTAAAEKASGKAGVLDAHDRARLLLSSPAPAIAELGLEQARLCVELLGPKAPAVDRLIGQRLLLAALFSRGKKEEAEKVAGVVEDIEDELDREYLKAHVPFKTTPFAGRKGKSRRAVVVEMVTNADVLVCAATDIAFDALRQTYKPADVVFLQYHRPAAAPDPLAVAAVDARVKQYGEVHAGNVPSILIDGTATEALGGHRTQAKQRYETLRGRIDKALEAPEQAMLALKATRKNDQIEVKADVSELAAPGERMRLHLLLTENVIRYEGNNGQRLHHDVVRAQLTPAEGVKLEKKAVSHTAKVDLMQVRKAILAHLTALAKQEIYPPERPIALRELKVVAVVQEASTNRVLQAAVVAVK